MIDFLICYEHTAREVENDALIEYELIKRGYTCEIIPFNGPGYFQHWIYNKARVVVTPWLRYDENVFHYLKMAMRPYKLVNLQWEQVYSQYDLKSGMVATSGQATNAYHLCWGVNSKERLLSDGVVEKNLFITGAIQLDYGRPSFAAYYLDRESIASELHLDPSEKWILLVSSFAYVNYGNEAIRRLEEEFNCNLDEQVQLHKDSQSAVLDWIERLLQQTDCEFIYRPHPSEKVDDRLKSMGASYPHFHIISSHSVKQWAKVSDKVNLWISTSNAEISAMGIDYAIIRPIPILAEIEVETMQGEEFITNYDDFFQYNTSTSNWVNNLSVEQMKKLSRYYSYDVAVPSYVRVADCLEHILKSTYGAAYHFSLKQHFIFGWREFKKCVISLIMEIYQDKPYRIIIDGLPTKKVIKKNIRKNLDKYTQGKLMESVVLQYMGKSSSLTDVEA